MLSPWVRLASLSNKTLSHWADTSLLFKLPCGIFELLIALYKTCLSLFSPLVSSIIISLSKWLTIGGAIVLLWALTSQSTSIIGLGTWALLVGALHCFFISKASVTSGKANAVSVTWNSLDLMIGLYFLSAVLSTAFSSYFHTSLIGLSKALTFLAGYTGFRLLFLLYPSTRVLLPSVMILLALHQSLVGFYQYTHHVEARATWVDPETNPELNMTRIFGTIQPLNPNLLAGFLVQPLGAILGFTALFLLAKPPKYWLFSALCAIVAITILIAVVLTGSRGGYIAIAGLMTVLFALLGHVIWHDSVLKTKRFLKPAWIIILVSLLCLVSVAILRSPKLQHRIGSMFAMRNDSSISYRLNVYNSSLKIIKDNPIVGIGPGNSTFKQVYGLYMIPGYNALGTYSVPLEITVEQGLIGLSMFILFLGALLIQMLFALDSNRVSLSHKFLLLSLFLPLVGGVAYGIFDTIWYRPAVSISFWLFAAAFASTYTHAMESQRDNPNDLLEGL